MTGTLTIDGRQTCAKLTMQQINFSESLMTDLMESDLIGNLIVETLDFETQKILNEMEMDLTMTTLETHAAYGSLKDNGNQFIAEFTEEGSSAIARMEYDGELLNVMFQNSPDTNYQYSISEETRQEIFDIVENRLSGNDVSVGAFFQKMLRSDKLTLI